MARISNAQLTLTTVGANIAVEDNIEVNVTYNAGINPLERFLVANGLALVERIAVIGVDPPNTTTGPVLLNFPVEVLPVTPGAGAQAIPRNRSIIVPRSSLQEDNGLGDDDEIRCRITIDALNLPEDVTGFTDQEILRG
jgi:hypothetical protein